MLGHEATTTAAKQLRDHGASLPGAQTLPPTAALGAFIHSFEYHPHPCRAPGTTVPLLPGPSVTLAIALRETWEAIELRSGLRRRWPDTVLTGPKTYRVAELFSSGNPSYFVVVFQPGATYRLFGVPAYRLVNQSLSAEKLLGPSVASLRDQIRSAHTPADMRRAAESFFLERCESAQRVSVVDQVAQLQLQSHGSVPVAELIRASGYRRHQFEREFIKRVGLQPKLYARVARFHYVLRLRAAHPALSWMAISHEAGYFDQNHLVKEFWQLIGNAPSSMSPLSEDWNPSSTLEPKSAVVAAI
jgi:AraC-like DNA-binding protein